MEDEPIPGLEDLLSELDRQEEGQQDGGEPDACAGPETPQESFADPARCTLTGGRPDRQHLGEEAVLLLRDEAKSIAEAEHRAFEARLQFESLRAEEERRRRALEAAAEARERAAMAAEEAPERELRARLAATRREEETRKQLAKEQARRRKEREAAGQERERRRQERREAGQRREQERQERERQRLRARMERLVIQGYALGPEGWVRMGPAGGAEGEPLDQSGTPSEAEHEEEEEEEDDDGDEDEDGEGGGAAAAPTREPEGGDDAVEPMDRRPPGQPDGAEAPPLEEVLAQLDRAERECWASGEHVPPLEDVLAAIGSDAQRHEEELRAAEVREEFSRLGRVEADEDEAGQSREIRAAKQLRPDFDWSGALKAEKTLKYYNYDFDESRQEGTNSLEERQARSAAIAAKLEKARNRLSVVRWKAAGSRASSSGGQAYVPGASSSRAVAALPSQTVEDDGELSIAHWPWAAAKAEPARVKLEEEDEESRGGFHGGCFGWRHGSRELQEVD